MLGVPPADPGGSVKRVTDRSHKEPVELSDQPSGVNIAYLFIVHNNAGLVARTIRKLDSGNASFFIHVDRKSDLTDFQEALCHPKGNVFFTKRRWSICWMGYSMVAATFELMALARATGGDIGARFDYHVLLSGVDYPLKSSDEIEAVLAKSHPRNFLTYWKLHDLPDWLHKVEQFHYLDSKWHNQRGGPVFFGRINMPFYQIERIRRVAHRFLPERCLPLGMVPYGGSQWWMLTADAVNYVLDQVSKHPSIPRFFRFTHSPDELTFQTILMNSPFKDTIEGESDYGAFIDAWKGGGDPDFVTQHVRKANLRYIDWDKDREFPSILDERDHVGIMESGSLFGRKMDPVRSERLLGMIDGSPQ